MTSPNPFEGYAPFENDRVDVPCHTHYKIFGELGHGPPVIVVHGGLGAGHEYLLPFQRLWSLYQMPVVLYDQIGCAGSTHIRHLIGDKSVWTVDMFVAELQSLLKYLGIDSADGPGYFVYGHSWGGMIAADFASRQPSGLRKLVLAGVQATMPLFVKGVWDLKTQLAPEHQLAIDEAMKKRDFTDPAYKKAEEAFDRMFICRAHPYPPELLAVCGRHQEEDPTTYKSLVGDSFFLYDGLMGQWNGLPLFPLIRVPTLVTNGEFDTTQDMPTRPLSQLIPDVRWVTIPHASHISHLDSSNLADETMKLVGDFFTQGSISQCS